MVTLSYSMEFELPSPPPRNPQICIAHVVTCRLPFVLNLIQKLNGYRTLDTLYRFDGWKLLNLL